jgi:DNA-binding FadR family transcriptional regulator
MFAERAASSHPARGVRAGRHAAHGTRAAHRKRTGRGSVREALRILETQGLVRTHAGRPRRIGRHAPSDVLLAQQIDSYAKTRELPLLAPGRRARRHRADGRAARALIAPDDDLATLRRVSDRLDAAGGDDVRRFLRENVKWHDAMAAACGNDLLRAFARRSRSSCTTRPASRTSPRPDVRAVVSRSHRRILDAVERLTPRRPQRRTERDIAAYGKYLARC